MPSDPDAMGLKPCPFCGGPATMERDHHMPGFCGMCRACDFSLDFLLTEDQAAAAWNRRAPLPPAPLDRAGGGEVEGEG